MKKGYLILLITSIVINNLALCQHDSRAIVEERIKPPSPSVYNLGRYGEVPVSNYTGVPSINIPLYAINYKDVNVPISLSYHAGGIKVKDESSIVGLGWSLICGGSITQTIVDDDDLRAAHLQKYMGPGYWEMRVNVLAPFYENLVCGLASTDNSAEYFGLYGSHQFLTDREPDIFSFNFLGYSGKFYYDMPNNKFAILDKQNIEIKVSGTDTIAAENRTWTVYLPDGTELQLGFNEGIQTNSASGDSFKSLTWFVTKIITPIGREINLSYSRSSAHSMILPSFVQKDWKETIVQYSWVPNPALNLPYLQVDRGNRYYACYLDEITFDNGRVTFGYEESRIDVLNAKRLSNIKVYSGTELIKHYQFQNNSYFSSDHSYHSLPPVHVHDGLSLDQFIYRLKLNGFNEVLSGANYSFVYNSQNLPYKDSYGVDYWGYYSGRKYATTFVPDIKLVYDSSDILPGINSIYTQFVVANRSANDTFSKASILEEIHYPTGGYTKFIYESNDFSNRPSIKPLDAQNNSKGGGIRIAKIMDYDALGNVKVKKYLYKKESSTASSGRLMAPLRFQRRYNITNWVLKTHGIPPIGLEEWARSVHTFHIIDSESYAPISNSSLGHFVGYDRTEVLDGEFGENGREVFEYHNTEDSYYPHSMLMSATVPNTPNAYNGLLKSKTSFDNRGIPVQKENYKYINFNTNEVRGMTFYYDETPIPTTPECNQWAAVGYSVYSNMIKMVSQEVIPYSSKISLNTSALDTFIYNPNGVLASSSRKRSNGQTEKIHYKYPFNLVSIEFPAVPGPLSDEMRAAISMAKYNYLVPIEKVQAVNDKVISATYTSFKDKNNISFQDQNRPMIVPTKEWSFKSTGTGLISLSESLSSSTFELSKGLLGTPISILKDNFYTNEADIYYDTTDIKGNVLQYHNNEGVKNCIIWDYAKTLRIAEVSNAHYQSIAYTSFEADGSGNWVVVGNTSVDVTCPTGSRVFNLSQGGASLSKVLAPGKYIISYWIKGSSPLSVAGSVNVKQGKSINGWTCFEHIITSGGGNWILSGAAIIDEVRLYPVDAFMKTFTHTPLIGITSICDERNAIKRYIYDSVGRLQAVKNEDGDIIQTMEYHYKGQ